MVLLSQTVSEIKEMAHLPTTTAPKLSDPWQAPGSSKSHANVVSNYLHLKHHIIFNVINFIITIVITDSERDRDCRGRN